MRNVPFEQTKTHPDCFFKKKDPWGHGNALWVMVVLVFVAPLAVSSLRHLRMENDVESWLPAKDPAALEYAWCREHFPGSEQLVMTWEGSTPDDPRLPILVEKLQGHVDPDGEIRGGLPYVRQVTHAGQVMQRMLSLGLTQDEIVERLRGTLLGEGHLKVRLTSAGREERQRTIQQLKSAAKRELGIDLVVYESVKIWAPLPDQEDPFDAAYETAIARQQPLELGDEAVAEIELLHPEHDLQISFTGISNQPELRQRLVELTMQQEGFATASAPLGRKLVDDCFTSIGSPIAVVITLSSAGVSEKQVALQAIREAAQAAFIPEENLLLGGRIVAGSEMNAGVANAAWNPHATVWYKKSVMLLSGLVGVFFALVSLKSLRLGSLVVGVSYYAALLGMALIPLTGGTMNMVLVVMPTLLMVLALSGAIHIANYWKHAVWEDPENAVSKATRMARTPCLMAAFTTSLGLISLAGSPLLPVRSFGIYAAAGSLISVGMVLYGLPALLQMFPLRRSRPEEVSPDRWLKYGAFVCHRWSVLATVSIIVSIICTCGLSNFQVETKIIKYFPADSPVVKSFQQFEDALSGITPVEVVIRFDEEAQRKLRFLERMEVVRKVEEQLRKHPEVSGAISLADFQPVRHPPAEDASTREKIFYNRRSHETEREVKQGPQAASFIAMSHAAGDQPAGAEELWRINAQTSAMSDADYTLLTNELSAAVQDVTRYSPGTTHAVTGTVPLFLRTQRAVLDSLILSSLAAFGLIALVMIWVLKDFVGGLLSMVPNLLPILSIFGLVSWFDQRIDVGTMVTASVALGIAVDGTLHLLTWFRDGLLKGLTRREAVKLALSHCGPAMWQTSAAVGIGLLVLFPADLLLISRFGWLMASLIAAALVADLVLLPSLLVGPLGLLMEHRLQQTQAAVTEEDDSPVPRANALPPAPHMPLAPASPHARQPIKP